ncbi:sentrin-specific protease 1 [Drosophila eugracilis]|uniref:sentrin-specific protease 1 n=1 Tax=Drosophila eugracilis TaxID=29029 RepID=UPI0007E7470F|nr:sentrin-specific protease 1 [Drosophila eugracilis]
MEYFVNRLIANGAPTDAIFIKTMTEQKYDNQSKGFMPMSIYKTPVFIKHQARACRTLFNANNSGSQTQGEKSLLALERRQIERKRYADLVQSHCNISMLHAEIKPLPQQRSKVEVISQSLNPIQNNEVANKENTIEEDIFLIRQKLNFLCQLFLKCPEVETPQKQMNSQDNSQVKKNVENHIELPKPEVDTPIFFSLSKSCKFLKINYVEQFKQKAEKKLKVYREDLEHAKRRADKAHAKRIAFEKVHFNRPIAKPIVMIIEDALQSVEKEKSEFIPFTEEHLDLLCRLDDGSPEDVMVSKFNLNVHRSEIKILVSGAWFNDIIINFYMELLTERSEKRFYQLPSVYGMNTFFMPRLLQCGYNSVKRWTKKVDLFSKDLILVPVHNRGSHWCMAIIDMRKKTILYYDSLLECNKRVLDALEQYLRLESLDKHNKAFDTSKFRIEKAKNVPRQTNSDDCGVYSCMFAEYLSRDAWITFSQANMIYFRKKMALEILGCELWQ